MSLDITLKSSESKRETCEHCGSEYDNYEYVFNWNITHNLTKMASEAGVYEALWRPEEINATKAGDLIPHLEEGLNNLINKPEYFKKFNPENGWGNYEGLLALVEEYLSACKENLNAKILISR